MVVAAGLVGFLRFIVPPEKAVMRPVPLALAVVVIVALGYLIQDEYLQRSDQASGEARLVQAEAAGSSSPKQFRRQRVSRVSASSEWK